MRRRPTSEKDASDVAKLASTPVDGRAANRRPYGAMNKLQKAELMASGANEVFGHLTEDEILAIKPVDVFRLVTIHGVRKGDYQLAMAAAERWAPYVHAKLAPKLVETEEPTIVIKGGLPDRPAQLN